jgi:hypothetical protein
MDSDIEIGFLLYTALSCKARKHHIGYISRADLKKERYEIQLITGSLASAGK